MAHWMFFKIKAAPTEGLPFQWKWIRQEGVHTLKTSRANFRDLDSCLADARESGMNPADTHEVSEALP
jgi:hypothetical protein